MAYEVEIEPEKGKFYLVTADLRKDGVYTSYPRTQHEAAFIEIEKDPEFVVVNCIDIDTDEPHKLSADELTLARQCLTNIYWDRLLD